MNAGSRLSSVSLRVKLALLAGVPVVGAVALSLLIAVDAVSAVARARALGSIESLAVLSSTMSQVQHEVQAERAIVALELGVRSKEIKPREAAPASADIDPATIEREAREQSARTDAAVKALDSFLAQRDTSKLPPRLLGSLTDARRELLELPELRRRAHTSPLKLDREMHAYDNVATSLISATAALTELSDDGELLRAITALVAVLELRERDSQVHAVLDYVFASGHFPPGSYRGLVTLLTEANTYLGALQTSATRAQLALYDAHLGGEAYAEAAKMVKLALDSQDESFGIDPRAWHAEQKRKLAAMSLVERDLNRQVRSVALAKQREMRQAVSTGLGLAGTVLAVSLVLVFIVTQGVLRSVRALTDATKRIGQGDLSARTGLRSGDELGALGRAFDEMVSEIDRGRRAQNEQARLSRELEIASTIQQALLPRKPTHPEFTFAGRMLPADEVGGDFYDVLRDDDSRHLWITMGDVSSHGLGAGLVMLMTQASFAAEFAALPDASPDTVLRGVNSVLCEVITNRLRDDKYVTAQLLVHKGGGAFQCAGGHLPPLRFSKAQGTTEYISVPGPWLGIMKDLPQVPVASLHLEEGDIMCLYTDGITEAQNEAGELFDVHRLEAALATAVKDSTDVEAIADRILADVKAFSSKRDDDWSLVVIRRTPHGKNTTS